MTPATNPNNDSDSVVAASYISDYHVHRQQKQDRSISGFQMELNKFSDDITKLGTIKKLVHISNGLWLTPPVCAQQAVEEAGTIDLPFNVHYGKLASSNDNDIELVTYQNLPGLHWQLDPRARFPGSHFLYKISTNVLNLVFIYFYYLISIVTVFTK